MRRILLLSGLWLLASTQSLVAQTVYRSVDPNGKVRYSDRPPEDAAQVEQRRYRVEPSALASFRYQADGPSQIAWVRNLLAGPIEVEVGLSGAAPIVAEPALPVRLTLPALSELRATTIRLMDGASPTNFALTLRTVPGDPHSAPDQTLYQLPFAGADWALSQGFGGSFSHQDAESRYAIDFGLSEGTPILAARAGVVMQVADDFVGSGLDREKFGARANHVRILHSDGSMAIYGHLAADSVVVREGARVSLGQQIGASGNTGFSTGPHLHFAVQINAGLRLESVRFKMAGVAGESP